jgi:hypothetical protein
MPDKHNRHANYEVLNFIGYGLSKFGFDFVHAFNFKTKSDFYNYIVDIGIAETIGTVKNRQDLFDGMETTGLRKGWWQKGPVYKHRKDYIDSLFGNLNVKDYAEVVKLSIKETLLKTGKTTDELEIKASPIIRSRFKNMQKTGAEAEYYFLNNYKEIDQFSNSDIEDARLLGDGYDFQLTSSNTLYLAEIKGVRLSNGHIRMTKNEFDKAKEFKNEYALVVIHSLELLPKMITVFNPANTIEFERRVITSEQVYFQSAVSNWK